MLKCSFYGCTPLLIPIWTKILCTSSHCWLLMLIVFPDVLKALVSHLITSLTIGADYLFEECREHPKDWTIFCLSPTRRKQPCDPWLQVTKLHKLPPSIQYSHLCSPAAVRPRQRALDLAVLFSFPCFSCNYSLQLTSVDSVLSW